jgi:gas vesicle protein
MRTVENLLWFLVGASIGAGIALLYAPQSGKETRKMIRRKAEDTKDSLVEAGEHFKDALVEKGEEIVDAGKGAYKKGLSAVANAAGSAAGLLGRARG